MRALPENARQRRRRQAGSPGTRWRPRLLSRLTGALSAHRRCRCKLLGGQQGGHSDCGSSKSDAKVARRQARAVPWVMVCEFGPAKLLEKLTGKIVSHGRSMTDASWKGWGQNDWRHRTLAERTSQASPTISDHRFKSRFPAGHSDTLPMYRENHDHSSRPVLSGTHTTKW